MPRQTIKRPAPRVQPSPKKESPVPPLPITASLSVRETPPPPPSFPEHPFLLGMPVVISWMEGIHEWKVTTWALGREDPSRIAFRAGVTIGRTLGGQYQPTIHLKRYRAKDVLQ